VLAAPDDTEQVQDLLRFRVQAWLQEGNAQEAIKDAKSLFNVASSKFTPTALLLLAQCIEQSFPKDPQAYERFQKEQMAGASIEADPPRSHIMATIQVNGKLYAEAEERHRKDPLAWGNLLLLADRAQEARKVFAELADEDKDAYVEAMARSIKAEDGTIGRANRYLLTAR
jgi:hypothetical protein